MSPSPRSRLPTPLRALQVALGLILCLAVAACSDGATAPAPPSFEGRYTLVSVNGVPPDRTPHQPGDNSPITIQLVSDVITLQAGGVAAREVTISILPQDPRGCNPVSHQDGTWSATGTAITIHMVVHTDPTGCWVYTDHGYVGLLIDDSRLSLRVGSGTDVGPDVLIYQR